MDWIVRVIKGPDQGLEHRVAGGQTIVGRSPRAGLKLTAPDVWWEHAVITRNGDECLIENLSASGTYMDGQKLAAALRLRDRDQIRLSPDTVLRFEAPGGGSLLGRRGAMGWIVGVLAAGALALVVYKVLQKPVIVTDEWNGAYALLSQWLAGEVSARRVPPQVLYQFHTAWRLEQAGNFENSRTEWLRLQTLLGTLSPPFGPAAPTDVKEPPLQSMLRGNLSPDAYNSEDKARALGQFVMRRLKFSLAEAKKTSKWKP